MSDVPQPLRVEDVQALTLEQIAAWSDEQAVDGWSRLIDAAFCYGRDGDAETVERCWYLARVCEGILRTRGVMQECEETEF